MGQGKNNRKNGDENQGPGERGDETEKPEKEIGEEEDNRLEECGQVILKNSRKQRKIRPVIITNEAEGHKNFSGGSKTTRYDHVLPKLAEIGDNSSVDGLLILPNISGGDVGAGLTTAEMIVSLSLFIVSLVLGGSHSADVPLAVSISYPSIVPSGITITHPVRMAGVIIGITQTYEYFEMIRDRILTFVTNHAGIAYDQFRGLMHSAEMLARNLGTMLMGGQAVDAGLISRVGGIEGVLGKLYEMIDKREHRR